MIRVYTGAAAAAGPGGWAAVVVDERGRQNSYSGPESSPNLQRIEMKAAIEGLLHTPPGADVTVFSRSMYLAENAGAPPRNDPHRDLWTVLERLVSKRAVVWNWVNHAGDVPLLDEAFRIARNAAGIVPPAPDRRPADSLGNLPILPPFPSQGKEPVLSPEPVEGSKEPGIEVSHSERAAVETVPPDPHLSSTPDDGMPLPTVAIYGPPPSLPGLHLLPDLPPLPDLSPLPEPSPPDVATPAARLLEPPPPLPEPPAEKGGSGLTHLDEEGKARMVDVSAKGETDRIATARGRVVMKRETLDLIRTGQAAKGDVLAVARVAGIMAAKQTPHLIPLCHPLLLSKVEVDFNMNEEECAVEIKATVKTTGKTGVEMEALTAVSVSALTIYDMCKAVDRGMRIEGIRLARKTGGKSGDIILE